MLQGKSTSFGVGYFHPRPCTAQRMFTATHAALREKDVVPSLDKVTDAQVDIIRAAYMAPRGALGAHGYLRRVSAESFLKPYVGDRLDAVQPWRVSSTWTFLYFVEKMFRERDAKACAMWRMFTRKKIPKHAEITTFLARVLVVGHTGAVHHESTKAFRRTLSTGICLEEIACIVAAGGNFFGENRGPTAEAAMRRSFTLLVFPSISKMLVVDAPLRPVIPAGFDDTRIPIVVLERITVKVTGIDDSKDAADGYVSGAASDCSRGGTINDWITDEKDAGNDVTRSSGAARLMVHESSRKITKEDIPSTCSRNIHHNISTNEDTTDCGATYVSGNKFQNMNLIFLQPELYPQLPILSRLKGLDVINRVAPHLKSLVIKKPQFDRERAYLQFGPHLFQVKNFHLSHMFEIIYNKCVNLEVVSIDTHILSSELMAKIVENNPKLRVLKLTQNAIRDIFPKETTIPNLKEIYLHGLYADIRGFSSLSQQLSVIDMTHCRITTDDLPELLREILQHKESLQCLRMKLIVKDSEEPYCSAFKAALGKCSSLTIFRIAVRRSNMM